MTHEKSIKNYIFCALDFKDIKITKHLLNKIADQIGGIKIGLEFFLANGKKGVRELQKFKLPIFLDLKLHDIPNTVKRSVESIIDLRPEYLSVHISGGENMLKIIERNNYTKIIGITLLTSLDEKDLVKQGIYNQAKEQVIQLVKIAKKARLDGVVSSPSEIPLIRKISSENFIIISPGIRLKRDSNDDQKRVMSPGNAILNGATKIVIGRSITNSKNPLEAIKKIQDDILKKLSVKNAKN